MNEIHTCTLCGHSFYVLREPAAEWERGAVRPITKLTAAERKLYRNVDGMPISRYLCGRCYADIMSGALR